MNPLRSVGARLSIALALVVAAALAGVYAIVVPSLERNLIDAKLAQLGRAAKAVARDLELDVDLREGAGGPFAWQDFLERASGSANARVVLFRTVSVARPAIVVFQDSQSRSEDELDADPVALHAALGAVTARGTVERRGGRFAEVARPVGPQTTLLLSADLHDSLGNVKLVRRRLLLAGGLALLSALVVGYGAASMFARRIRRLERAADRIAAGDLGEPIAAERPRDELDQLAEAFERMRRRLAGLEDARREFVANASHELRTPLFSLGGFLELMDDDELDDETRREFLRTMREQVERLTKLATELLDLSRLDAGRMHVAREEIDLVALARSLADEFEGLARTTGHELTSAAAGDVLAVGDELRARQIGAALVENALLHTPPGTRVRLSAVPGRRPGLEVEDRGPGIPADQTAHVFERFYRGDAGRASGSGLGLAIARELAERMGGALELESAPRRTVFTLRLPRPEARAVFSRENAAVSESVGPAA